MRAGTQNAFGHTVASLRVRPPRNGSRSYASAVSKGYAPQTAIFQGPGSNTPASPYTGLR